MFASAELGHSLSKAEYKKIETDLRADLLDSQYELSANGTFPVIILISGVRGAGKGATVNLLNEWMDPRHITSIAFDNPTDEERERPPMWRYWRAMPPKGKIGILFGSWYTAPITDRVFKRNTRSDLKDAVVEINRFEKMLADENALILKFWFHLSKDDQRRRLKALAADPLTSWRITQRDWDFFKHYDRFRSICEPVLRDTSTGHAPWLVVEGVDAAYRSVTVGKTLLEAMRKRLAQKTDRRARRSEAPPLVQPVDNRHVLDAMDLAATISKKKYQSELKRLQARLAVLTRKPAFQKHSVVCVFEGMDAAGKGGGIRRVTASLDARLYRVVPIAAPTDEERAQPYLWRFWRHVPRKGRFTIFDRSWYGRVLVERVEGFCSEADWMRAYSEINDFERQMAKEKTIVVKYWLQISQEEQLVRFKDREKTRFKHFKITEEDWRNREKWDLYQAAAADMIDRTSTPDAPWTLVSANDKLHARITIVRTLLAAIESAI
ncbi:MAG: polyphosphate:AMP phosphotransferase [Pseudomonadota bacterium]